MQPNRGTWLQDRFITEVAGRRRHAQQCPGCGSYFLTTTDLMCHPACTESRMIGGRVMFLCSRCTQSYGSMDMLKDHYDRSHNQRLFKCIIRDCDHLPQELDQIRHHVQRAHLDVYWFCKYDEIGGNGRCQMRFTDKYQLNKHFENMHFHRSVRQSENVDQDYRSRSRARSRERDDRRRSSSRPPDRRPDPSPSQSSSAPRPSVPSDPRLSRPGFSSPDVGQTHEHYTVSVWEAQQCPTCKNLFTDPAKHQVHRLCFKPIDKNGVYKCHKFNCFRLCESIDEMVDHMSDHLPPRYCCKHCRERFTRKEAVLKHYTEKHGPGRPNASGSDRDRSRSSSRPPAGNSKPTFSPSPSPATSTPSLSIPTDPRLSRSRSVPRPVEAPGPSLRKENPAVLTAGPSTVSTVTDDPVPPHAPAGTSAQNVAISVTPLFTKGVRVAHIPRSSVSSVAAVPMDGKVTKSPEKSPTSVTPVSPVENIPKYGRFAPVQEPTPLTPIKLSMLTQTRPSVPESLTDAVNKKVTDVSSAKATPSDSGLLLDVKSQSVPQTAGLQNANKLPETQKAGLLSASSTPKRIALSTLQAVKRRASHTHGAPSKRIRFNSATVKSEPGPSSGVKRSPVDANQSRPADNDNDSGVPFVQVDRIPVACPVCAAMYNTPSAMMSASHICAKKGDGTVWCPFCLDKEITTITTHSGWKRHMEVEHFNHRFNCTLCPATAPYKCILLPHYPVKHGIVLCPNTGCGLVFKKGSTLKRHIKKDHQKNLKSPSPRSVPLSTPNHPLTTSTAAVSVSDTETSPAVPLSAPSNEKPDDSMLGSDTRIEKTGTDVAASGSASAVSSDRRRQIDSDMDAMDDESLDSPDLAPMSFYDDADESGDGGVLSAETMEMMDQGGQSLDSNRSEGTQRDNAQLDTTADPQPTISPTCSPCVVDFVEIESPDDSQRNSDKEPLASHNSAYPSVDPDPPSSPTPPNTQTESIPLVRDFNLQSSQDSGSSAEEDYKSELGTASLENGFLCITLD